MTDTQAIEPYIKVSRDCHHCPIGATYKAHGKEKRAAEAESNWVFIQEGWVARSEDYWVCPGCARVCGWTLSVIKDGDGYLIVSDEPAVCVRATYCNDRGDWVLLVGHPLTAGQMCEVAEIVKSHGGQPT